MKAEERQKYIDGQMKANEKTDNILGVLTLVALGGFLLFRAFTDTKHDERDRSIGL